MDKYKNLGGNSGITHYEIGNDYIKIQFTSGKIYIYTYNSAGKNNIEIMKKLALKGQGLNSFIMNNVKDLYEDKY